MIAETVKQLGWVLLMAPLWARSNGGADKSDEQMGEDALAVYLGLRALDEAWSQGTLSANEADRLAVEVKAVRRAHQRATCSRRSRYVRPHLRLPSLATLTPDLGNWSGHGASNGRACGVGTPTRGARRRPESPPGWSAGSGRS